MGRICYPVYLHNISIQQKWDEYVNLLDVIIFLIYSTTNGMLPCWVSSYFFTTTNGRVYYPVGCHHISLQQPMVEYITLFDSIIFLYTNKG